MPKVTQNFTNRVRKLPKPTNAGQALQPLFEAISNALFAIDDLNATLPEAQRRKGMVGVEVNDLSDPDAVNISVSDDGIGLDAERYEAFGILDTDFKRSRGGKGVGRLFWLDAFKKISVSSFYRDAGDFKSRSFEFVLTNEEQIQPGPIIPVMPRETGTRVNFSGLRGDAYHKHFPKRIDTFLRYFSAHFIADFLVGSGPEVLVDINGDLTHYPSAISRLVVGEKMFLLTEDHPEFGQLEISGFTCDASASKGLDGMHQLHLLGDGRTVTSREIDKLLGVTRVTRDGVDDLVFHGCVSGAYLDQNVVEGRTGFTVEEKTLKELCRFCADAVKANMLSDQIAKYESLRKEDYREFVRTYPMFGFADEETQLARVPFGARSSEEFAAGLIKHQIRGEEKRQREVDLIIDQLEGEKNVPDNFAETVVRVAGEIKASEQRALAHHVVKRKLVLEVMERLILKVRKRGDDKRDFHLEKSLHTFICPMNIVGNNPAEIEPSPHDLWVVDERLAFTRSFASDKRLDRVLRENDSPLRPDLMVWDNAFGLGVVTPENAEDDLDLSTPLRKAMIVEFKRPGRTSYAGVEDDVERQITKYLRQLKLGEIETFDSRRVRFTEDCQFFCYVVADIAGDLQDQLVGWATTANGEGRVRQLHGQFEGSSIEVIQWSDLINDAWARNMATLAAAGLRRGDPVVK
ncbi:MAG: ATP-binding protein [Paracoccaceae bacterium]